MSDYIKREDAIDALYGYGKSAQDIIKRIPAADVVERKHGNWIAHSTAYEYCSECENIFSISSLFLVGGNDEPKYCPECGARMVDDDV